MLSNVELEKYKRQINLFGTNGQESLKRSTIFIAGAGGLGSTVSVYLAVAGIGRMIIADGDVVEKSNLNRQILHGNSDVKKYKVQSAKETIERLNPEVEIEIVQDIIDEDNVLDIVSNSDLIVDALDNFPTRYLLNHAALTKMIPLFHGAISGFDGQATTIIPGKTTCLRCLFPRTPPKKTPPALGATCGIIGSIQATEVLKYILGIGQLLENRLVIWDGIRTKMDEIAVQRNLKCPDCGQVRAIVENQLDDTNYFSPE